jgi:hypothetical protein
MAELQLSSPVLTASTLRETLIYDPETGIFTRRIATGRWGRSKPGTPVGYVDRLGRVNIRLEGLHRAHRLAWLYQTGEWPIAEVDHVNGNPSDNRWSNLRPATRSQNTQNAKMKRFNSHGWKGIYFCKQTQKWKARVIANGKSIYLGVFECPAAAHFAYIVGSTIHHGEFARID